MKAKVFKISLNILAAIGLSLLLSTPLPAEQKAIKVFKTDKAVNGVDVDDPMWIEAPLQDVSLMTAPPVHPAVSGTAAILKLTVQAVQDKDRLYIKLRW